MKLIRDRDIFFRVLIAVLSFAVSLGTILRIVNDNWPLEWLFFSFSFSLFGFLMLFVLFPNYEEAEDEKS